MRKADKYLISSGEMKTEILAKTIDRAVIGAFLCRALYLPMRLGEVISSRRWNGKKYERAAYIWTEHILIRLNLYYTKGPRKHVVIVRPSEAFVRINQPLQSFPSDSPASTAQSPERET